MASSISRRMALSSTLLRGTGSRRRPSVRSSSTKMRYPRSVGMRPAEVCGCSSSPASSSRASSARTVDGPQGTSSCSAIHLEPTGWSRSTWASTTLRRMNLCREEISTALNLDAAELCLGVLDDLLAVLLGVEVDDDGVAASLPFLPRHRDRLLGESHPAELDRQAPQR